MTGFRIRPPPPKKNKTNKLSKTRTSMFFHFLVEVLWTMLWQAFPHSNKGDLENCQKMQKRGLGAFWVDKGGGESFFMFSWWDREVLRPFLVGTVLPLPAMHGFVFLNLSNYSGLLLEHASIEQKSIFLAEAVFLKRMVHHNVLSVMHLCGEDESKPPMVIYPYMNRGNLKNYLRLSRTVETLAKVCYLYDMLNQEY